MPRDVTPPDLADVLQDIDRRLRALERSPQAPRTSIAGGRLRVLTDDGDPVVELGQLDSGHGILVYNPDGSVRWQSASLPAGFVPPLRPSALPEASSTSTAWQQAAMFAGPDPGGRFVVPVLVDCPPGATGELELYNQHPPGFQITTRAISNADDGQVVLLEASGLTGPFAWFTLAVRRLSGAGTVTARALFAAQRTS